MMILKGNLAREPELLYIGTERMAVVNGTVFAYRGKTLQGEQLSDVPVAFTAWGSQAQYIASNYKKGDKINIVGDLKLDFFEKDGVKVQKLSCVVKAIPDDETQKSIFNDVMVYCRMVNDSNIVASERLNFSPVVEYASAHVEESYYAPIEEEC